MTDTIKEQIPFFTKFDILEDIQEKAGTLPKGVIMRIRGKVAHANKVTANGTLYERALWEREIANSQSKIVGREMLSLANHPERTDDGKVKPANFRDLIGGVSALEMQESGEVFAEFDLADTEAGKDTAALARAGFQIPVSSRAGGSATKKVLTKDHPLAKENTEHVGREVNFINSDFKLRTFDAVVDQSVEGAKVHYFQEDKIPMEFDITKLTEENWKEILGSEKIKETVTGALSEAQKEFNEKIAVQTREQVADYMASDEFAARFETDEDKKDDKPVTKVECQECKSEIIEGVSFCGKCGRRAIMEKKKTPDEKDATIDELKKQVGTLAESVNILKSKNDELTDERKREKEIEVVRVLVEQKLEGKSPIVIEKVKEQIDFETLKEEKVEEVVTAKITFVEDLFKVAGFDPATLPAGKGISQPVEDDRKKEGKELTEGQKKANKFLSALN